MRFLTALSTALTISIGLLSTPFPAPALAQQPPLIVRGEMTDDDPPVSDLGHPFDVYRFTAAAGTSVILTLESTSFNTHMVLIFDGQDGLKEIARSDNMAPNNTNSQLSGLLPHTGEYTIVMSPAEVTGRGAYMLTIEGL